MAKKQQQNKTTKHTIEFSNNTRKTGNPATVLRNRGSVNTAFVPNFRDCHGAPSPSSSYALDLGSETRKVLHEQRIATIDVEDVVDLGVAVGDKSRQHQSGAGPDVRTPNRCA